MTASPVCACRFNPETRVGISFTSGPTTAQWVRAKGFTNRSITT